MEAYKSTRCYNCQELGWYTSKCLKPICPRPIRAVNLVKEVVYEEDRFDLSDDSSKLDLEKINGVIIEGINLDDMISHFLHIRHLVDIYLIDPGNNATTLADYNTENLH